MEAEVSSEMGVRMPVLSQQLELITTQAMKAGFTGGLVVDFPNSAKAKK